MALFPNFRLLNCRSTEAKLNSSLAISSLLPENLQATIVFKREGISLDSSTPDKQNLPEESAAKASEPINVIGPGTIIDSRFEIKSFICKGGTSAVFKAKHLILDRPVAIKILQSAELPTAAMQRFQREALIISEMDHPHIVKVYGMGTVNAAPYIALEFLDGISLGDLLKIKTRLSAEECLNIAKQILSALAHAHERGIVHRDLKPSNVMLTGSNQSIKIVDFGIAKLLPDNGKELQKLTNTGDLFGTPKYMSPEQCQGKPLDARSDLYSLASLLYESLDGQVPFDGNNSFEIIFKRLHEAPRESKYLQNNLGTVILSALAVSPDERPQTAAAFNEALSDPAMFAKTHKQKSSKSSRSKNKALLFGLLALLAIISVPLLQQGFRLHQAAGKEANKWEATALLEQSHRASNSLAKAERDCSEMEASIAKNSQKQGIRHFMRVLGSLERAGAENDTDPSTLPREINLIKRLNKAAVNLKFNDEVPTILLRTSTIDEHARKLANEELEARATELVALSEYSSGKFDANDFFSASEHYNRSNLADDSDRMLMIAESAVKNLPEDSKTKLKIKLGRAIWLILKGESIQSKNIALELMKNEKDAFGNNPEDEMFVVMKTAFIFYRLNDIKNAELCRQRATDIYHANVKSKPVLCIDFQNTLKDLLGDLKGRNDTTQYNKVAAQLVVVSKEQDKYPLPVEDIRFLKPN